jgi:hypothetical protein
MVEFYCNVRVIKDRIVDAIKKTDTSDEIKNQVLDICNDIEVNVLNKILEDDDNDLIIELIFQMKKFDILIRIFEAIKEEDVLFLLRCYV